MANPVPTVTTGDLWTAANQNTYVRDNLAEGVPLMFQAAGDLAVGSGLQTAARLAKGSNLQVLEVSSAGAVAWGGPVGCVVSYDDQSIAGDGNNYDLSTVGSESYDSHGFHTGSAKQIVIPAGFPTGWYHFNVICFWDSHGTAGTYRTIGLANNGNIQAISTVPNPSGGPAVWMSLDYMLSLAAGDSLTVFCSQASTGALYIRNVKAALFRVR